MAALDRAYCAASGAQSNQVHSQTLLHIALINKLLPIAAALLTLHFASIHPRHSGPAGTRHPTGSFSETPVRRATLDTMPNAKKGTHNVAPVC